jgi:hypothetical protein
VRQNIILSGVDLSKLGCNEKREKRESIGGVLLLMELIPWRKHERDSLPVSFEDG